MVDQVQCEKKIESWPEGAGVRKRQEKTVNAMHAPENPRRSVGIRSGAREGFTV